MKMTYERPMMQAELYQANQYVAACGDAKGFLDVDKLVLGFENSMFGGWMLPNAGNSQTVLSKDSTQSQNFESLYAGMEFEATTQTEIISWAGNTSGQKQYYWKAEVGGTNYYLEYSIGRTNANNNKDSFVLYKEDGGASDELNINFWTYGGYNSDNNNGGSYDDSLAGIFFNQRIVDKS